MQKCRNAARQGRNAVGLFAFLPSCIPALLVVAVFTVAAVSVRAAEHSGRVTFNGVAVPGATVIATRGDQREQTVTDEEGRYRFADLAEGEWSVAIEMFGFAAVSGVVTAGSEAGPR